MLDCSACKQAPKPVSADAELLRREIEALRHELRRVNDGLERSPSHALERRARQLRENIDLCEQDLRRALASPANPSSAE